MLRIISIIFLLFNGLSACFGGLALMLGPTGTFLRMPPEWLRHSPFQDFFVPGLLLFLVNGVGNLVTVAAGFMNARYYPQLVTIMGIALSVWITVEVLMIDMLSVLQLVYGGIGIVLVVFGLMMWMGHDKVEIH